MNTMNDSFALAEKLRNDDPEQFYTLVRMHLSFVLDMNTEDSDANSEKKFRPLKWNLPFSKKQKGVTKNCSDGSPLSPEIMNQMQQLILFLSQEENISQEGIFRRSGKVTRQQELKSLLSQGAILDLSDGQFSVHDCASVLKNVLSELPESILTDAHYPAYCQIAEFCVGKNSGSEDRLLRALQLLILLLPTENRNFFQEIIALLHLAASHESTNRMSPDNLATLFTPHLLCPRKLSPEALHTNSQIMSRVVAFMIQKGSELFEIPPTLATDVRAYWNKKEKRKMSPLKQMNESVCDGTAANTVFTFVDRERTAQENGANPTETALAQLYAHIQSLPESSKKRKLIKQFNKENGHGTPLRQTAGKKRTRSRSLGDSIKKHLPVFSKNAKKQHGDDETNLQQSPVCPVSSTKKHIYSSQKENAPILKPALLAEKPLILRPKKKIIENDQRLLTGEEEAIPTLRKSFKNTSRSKSCEVLDAETDESSDLAVPIESISPGKISLKRKSPSPILSPNKEEEGKRLERDWSVSNQRNVTNLYELCLTNRNNNEKDFRRNPDSVFDNILKTPITKFNNISSVLRSTNTDCFISSPNNTNRIPIRYAPKSHLLMTTSTPAPSNNCLLTPIVDKNNSMSPITRSTQRMPKAMQETMMTPRSRKPVISLSGTDLCHLATVDSWDSQSDEPSNPKLKKSDDYGKKLILEDFNEGTGSDSLSSTFRDYLFSRSVLTASPVDLSFSSRTDDFLSLSEKNSSVGNEDFKSLPESILNEAGLSESLLYCLDGNDPRSPDSKNDSKILQDCSCSSFSECKNHVNHHVYETAL